MGIVRIYKKKIKAKLDNRGTLCMFIGYSKDHEEDVYRMLNLSTLKVKNTRDVIWLNKCYGEWKGIKGYSSHEFEVIKKPSSDTDSSDSVTNKNKTTAEKDTSSDDSSDDEDEESDNSGNIADRTRAKLSQQDEDDLVVNMNRMRISETAAISMQELVEWCLVGGEDADYTNPKTFKEVGRSFSKAI